MNEFLSAREYATQLNVSLRNNHKEWLQNNLAKKIPYMLGEAKIHLGEVDKVFASEWLSEDVVIFGTKCNQLMLLEIPSGRIVDIPLLKSTSGSSEDDYFSDELISILSTSSCGIHSIQRSPGNSKLATSGHNPNHLAVYSLPNLDPYIIGKGHKDWIFATQWLGDKLLVTSSRDSTMALWSVEYDHYSDAVLADSVPSILPLCKFRNISGPSEGSCKVRDLAYNSHDVHLAALQTGTCAATVHLWDCYTFQQVYKYPLPFSAENVCVEVDDKIGLYAVGSRSHITFIDSRVDAKSISSIHSKDKDSGVRSLQFTDHLISIGTGQGNLYFYDLKADRYLSKLEHSLSQLNMAGPSTSHEPSAWVLKTTLGWLKKDETYRDFFSGMPEPPNAIYTHRYSPSKSKLFVAGGPLPLGLCGNYCALWH